MIGDVWRDVAACATDDGHLHGLFFPPAVGVERRDQRERRQAKAAAICAACPVADLCGADAIRHGSRYGVWAGTVGETLIRDARMKEVEAQLARAKIILRR